MSLRPRALIHLPNIVSNWRTLRASQPSSTIAAVVKANAYGHGLREVGEALHDAGCDHFFVAHSFEGEALRKTIGPHAVIYVLNGPDIYEEPLYRNSALTPVINSEQQFQTLVTWVQSDGKLRNGYALHFDTGMNRLGLPTRDSESIAEAVSGFTPSLLLTHLACADLVDHPLNEVQRLKLERLSSAFPDVPTSLANSDGVWLGPDYQSNLSRAGIALYGGGHPPESVALKPGMTLEAPIVQVRVAEAGETVGYGASYRLTQRTVLATVALGYGDGFPRSASNSGYANIKGVHCPIAGRVSMDLVTLDVSAAMHLARPGVFAQFLGQDVPLEDQARKAGTIGYELTTGLLPRVERLYPT